MCSQRRKGRAVRTPLSPDKDAPRVLKITFSLTVVEIPEVWISNMNYNSASKVHTHIKTQQNQIPRKLFPQTIRRIIIISEMANTASFTLWPKWHQTLTALRERAHASAVLHLEEMPPRSPPNKVNMEEINLTALMHLVKQLLSIQCREKLQWSFSLGKQSTWICDMNRSFCSLDRSWNELAQNTLD